MKTLETPRLLLRPWAWGDLYDFYEYASNPRIGPRAGWPPHRTLSDTRSALSRFISGNEVRALELKSQRKVIGSIGVHADKRRPAGKAREIGFVLSEPYWGQGLMPEAVRAVLTHLFLEEGVDVVSCSHYPNNLQSRAVIEKCGFQYEGTLRSTCERVGGGLADECCYSMLRREYFGQYNRRPRP